MQNKPKTWTMRRVDCGTPRSAVTATKRRADQTTAQGRTTARKAKPAQTVTQQMQAQDGASMDYQLGFTSGPSS